MSKFIRMSVTGMSTPPGCRKPRRYFETVSDYLITDANYINFEEAEATAREYIAKKRKVHSARMVFNQAEQDGEMVFVTLLPFKTIELNLGVNHE